MSARTTICGATVVAALLVTFNVAAQPYKPSGVPPQRLNYSIYRSQIDAAAALGALKAAEDNRELRIESYAMIGRDLAGKVSVVDRRQSATRPGMAVGSMVELLGGPFTVGSPTAIGGGPTAYLAGSDIRMSKDDVKKLRTSLQPGEAAVISVVDEKWSALAVRLQDINAARTMSHPIPPMTAQPGFNDATRDPAPDNVPKSQRPKTYVSPPGAPLP